MEICRNRRRCTAMPVQKYKFKPFGQAIKVAGEQNGEAAAPDVYASLSPCYHSHEICSAGYQVSLGIAA